MRELPITAISELNALGRVDEMVLREFCCPGCGTSVAMDVPGRRGARAGGVALRGDVSRRTRLRPHLGRRRRRVALRGRLPGRRRAALPGGDVAGRACSDRIPVADLEFRRVLEEASYVVPHNAPERLFIVTLTGRIEVEVSDGEVRRFGPGAVTPRRGHARQGTHHARPGPGAPGDAARTAHDRGRHVMRAAVLRAPGALRIEELRDPRPGPGEVLVRVAACGVCHSDLHVIKGESPSKLPVVPGHEMAGTVAELGEGVDGPAPGTRVVAPFILPCGRCARCAAGRDDFCEAFWSLNRAQGTLYDGTTRLTRPTAPGLDGGPERARRALRPPGDERVRGPRRTRPPGGAPLGCGRSPPTARVHGLSRRRGAAASA